MKSPRSNQRNNFPFSLLAILVIIGASLTIALYRYKVSEFRNSQSDKIVSLANQSNETQKINLLEQAFLLDSGDPKTTELLAGFYKRRGDYKRAYDVYQKSDAKINPVYMGKLAMRIGDYKSAQKFYQKAVAEEESSESLAGLSISNFAQNNTQEGCKNADKSIRLNLSSDAAVKAVAICNIMKGTSELSKRQQIYSLAQSGLYTQALERFQSYSPKGIQDWKTISIIYKNTGDYNKAFESINSAIKQSPSNLELIEEAIGLLKKLNREDEANALSAKLDQLKLKNFQ